MHKSVTRAKSSNPLMGIESPHEARRIIRAGDYAGHTAGVAPSYVQGNLCILPKDLALEFAAFCQRNPKPCPLIGMGAPGDPRLPDLGDIDIRTDVPCYRVFKDGKLVAEPADIRTYWTDDLVAFVLGCSFSFELALLEAGLRLRHIERNTVVPMYRTNIDCVPAGRFKGKMVGFDAALHPGRCDPSRADHLALSRRAWGSSASGPSRGDRHCGHRQARSRRPR